MKALVFVFPVIFILFAFFFGFISYSVLLKKKPVIMSSKWLILLMGIGFLPAIVVNLIEFFISGPESIMQLMISAMFILLLVFYMYIIKGVSIYGITDDDFRKYLFQTLTNREIKFTEKINKIHLDELNTDINISFQEWMGTGMIKTKDKNKFDFKDFITEFKRNINENDVTTKKVTAYFYIAFSVIMVITSITFVFIFSKLV